MRLMSSFSIHNNTFSLILEDSCENESDADEPNISRFSFENLNIDYCANSGGILIKINNASDYVIHDYPILITDGGMCELVWTSTDTTRIVNMDRFILQIDNNNMIEKIVLKK